MRPYLIVGLGNIGDEYKKSRHNIGFMVLDAMAIASNISFKERRLGYISQVNYDDSEVFLLKPTTYMNLSGNAVHHWMRKKNIPIENLLVIVDDLALPVGNFRMRSKGSAGGHNGLAHINTILGTDEYARIRVGIGADFAAGAQVEYVLGSLNPTERDIINEKIPTIIDMIKSFISVGAERTMTAFNSKGRSSSKQ